MKPEAQQKPVNNENTVTVKTNWKKEALWKEFPASGSAQAQAPTPALKPSAPRLKP